MEQKDNLKKLKNRIDWFCENRINAFSPTISPAPKSSERSEIESIEEAIRYFAKANVEEIVVQRKYMGSYCDIYLAKNIEDTYFVSRNGYKINHIDLEKAIESCCKLHSRFNWNNLSLVIIQSEMMPWSALGKGLIDNEFYGYLQANVNHCQFLKQSDIYSKLEKVRQSAEYITYIADKQALTQKELTKKYPSHIIRQYNSVADFQVINLEQYASAIDIYKKQIDHFGREGELHFEPFNILKKVFDDGQEEFVNDNLSYAIVNDDEFLHLKCDSEENINQSIKTVYRWFESLASTMEEGIVIKPRTAFNKGLPPALKVRNNNYLVMIYGVDFQDNYNKYLYKRNIKTKLECSINDWALNWKILQVPYCEINKENYYLKNLVLDRILGEKIEATLDNRL